MDPRLGGSISTAALTGGETTRCGHAPPSREKRMAGTEDRAPWRDTTQDEWERVAHAGHDRPFVGCVRCARERRHTRAVNRVKTYYGVWVCNVDGQSWPCRSAQPSGDEPATRR